MANAVFPISTNGLVTVNGVEAIEIRWNENCFCLRENFKYYEGDIT